MVYLKITDRYDMTSSVYREHKAIMKQAEETMKTDIVFGLFEAFNQPCISDMSVR